MFPSARRALLAVLPLSLAASVGITVTVASSAAGEGAPSGVLFADCAEAPCTGVLAGAAYRVDLPERWNGTLLLWSHGYRPVGAHGGPDGLAAAAPDRTVAAALLERGFALAGSAYAANGWAVSDGVRAAVALRAFFGRTFGEPVHTYAWGESLGGLVTQTLAEQRPSWLSGVAPECGTLGGLNRKMDLSLDVAYAVRQLAAPSLQLTDYSDPTSAAVAYRTAAAAVRGDAPRVRALLAFAGALIDAPLRTRTQDGRTPDSEAAALREAVDFALGSSTVKRLDVERRVGGDPSTNVDVDYAARISPAERARIDAIVPGYTAAALAKLATGARVVADPDARWRAESLGDPTGALAVPTVTMHTVDDPAVLVQNERLFADRVRAQNATGLLLQLYIAPPDVAGTVDYGAGHCVFTDGQRLAQLTLLDRWVRSRVRPAPAAVAEAFSQVPGLDPGYAPPEWFPDRDA